MKRLLLLVVVLVAAAVFGGGALLGLVVRSRVAAAGTAAFGTRMTVASASVSLLGGSVTLSGLEVAQPAGFSADRAIRVERIDLSPVGWRGLIADPAALRTIWITSPEVTIEVGAGGTSLGRLMENLQARPKIPARRLQVGLVHVTTPSLRLVGSLVLKAEQTFALPGFELADVRAGGDVTLAELLLQVLARMLGHASLPADVAALLRKDEVLRRVQSPVEGVKKALDDLLRPK